MCLYAILFDEVPAVKKNKQKTIFDDIPENTPIAEEEYDVKLLEKEKRLRRKKWDGVNRFLNRITGFIIVAVLVFGCAGLALEYQLVKGPSPAFSDMWIHTISETRRFDFINNLFLSEEEVAAALTPKAERAVPVTEMVVSAPVEIQVDTNNDQWEVGGIRDEDGDGIIYFEFKESGSQCYMIAVQDPRRVFVGFPGFFGGNGLMLEDMVSTYGALGGINAGGFIDSGGAGSGGFPDGITIIDGTTYSYQSIGGVGGFDANGIFHVGDYSIEECEKLGIINAVSFSPVLVVNGAPTYSWGESGSNPRTCIGQCADGTVLMLCVDGRQFFSPGLNYEELAWIMINYGAVNAINMDGGSSTCMMYEGEIKNNPTNAAGGTRYLPTAWLFK